MGFGTRTLSDNDPPVVNNNISPWLESDDPFFMLINMLAQRCRKCQRVTALRHLNEIGVCPDPQCQSAD